jgi:hypothetical protein
LDVNKIHFVLAAVDTAGLMSILRAEIERERSEGADLLAWDEYWNTLARPCYWDTQAVFFIKQMLQFALPEAFRRRVLDRLFVEFVSSDEQAFAAELYMSPEQLRLMVRSGMYLGSHGNGHHWLNSLSRPDQERDIDLSLQFLRNIGMSTTNWVMCYPHGAFDPTTLEIIKDRGCAIGLTTRSGVADLAFDSALELPRVDTNDIDPKLAWRCAGADPVGSPETSIGGAARYPKRNAYQQW